MQVEETALELLKRLRYGDVRLRASCLEQPLPLASFLELEADLARAIAPVLAEVVANFVSDNATSAFSEDSLPMVLWLSTTEGFVVRAALTQAQAILESLFPSSPEVVDSCLKRVKVVESCNLCTSMAVLEVVQDTIGAAPLLVLMDGLYDLAQQSKSMKQIAPVSTSLLVEFCMMLSKLLNSRMASAVHYRVVHPTDGRAAGRGQRFDPLPPQWKNMVTDRVTVT